MNNETQDERAGWKRLVDQMLARKQDPDTEPAYWARLRHGLNASTEFRAYPAVLPYAATEAEGNKLLRVAGLIATFPDIPQIEKGTYLKLGQSFFKVSQALSAPEEFFLDPGKPDVIATRLAHLHEEDFENATLSLYRLLKIANKTNIAFNFYELASTLLFWGDRLVDDSYPHRMSMLKDYYRGISVS